MNRLNFNKADYRAITKKRRPSTILEEILKDPGELNETMVAIEAFIYPQTAAIKKEKGSNDVLLARKLREQFGPSKSKFNPRTSLRKSKARISK